MYIISVDKPPNIWAGGGRSLRRIICGEWFWHLCLSTTLLASFVSFFKTIFHILNFSYSIIVQDMMRNIYGDEMIEILLCYALMKW